MTYGTVQANAIQGSINTFSPNSAVFRNRIINGAMVIDQRNAGASVTPTADESYQIDRWISRLSQSSKFSVQRNAGSVTPPAGFTNYLGITSLAATSVGTNDYFAIAQYIEGFNVADLGFGTANAKTITVSFWVRSSLTGTFGVTILNGAEGRAYPATYTINSANTWEFETITIPGDTTGTWATGNTSGLKLFFSLGAGATYSRTAGSWGGGVFSPTGATSVVGTNGATFYITGVQLEVGSTATSFDYRPYGTELALCQRYYWKISAYNEGGGAYAGFASGIMYTTNGCQVYVKYPVAMRAAATFTGTGLTVTGGGSNTSVSSPGTIYPGTDSALLQYNSLTSTTTGYAAILISNGSTTSFLSASAEL